MLGPLNASTAKSRRPSVSKRPYAIVINGSAATTGLANPVASTTIPSSGIIKTGDQPLVRLVFGGSTTDGGTVNYQVVLWSPVDTGICMMWIPTLIAKGVYTLSTMAMPSAVVADGLFADTITDTIGQTGTMLHSPADNSLAWLDVDLRNSQILQVQTDVGTATTAYVFGQLGESLGSFADITVAGTTLSTTDTNSAAILAAMQLQTGTGLTIARPSISQEAAGTTVLQAAVAGKIARLHNLVFVADAAGTWQIQDTDGTALTGAFPISANGSVDISRDLVPSNAIVVGAVGKGIQLVTVTAKVFGVASVSVEQ